MLAAFRIPRVPTGLSCYRPVDRPSLRGQGALGDVALEFEVILTIRACVKNHKTDAEKQGQHRIDTENLLPGQDAQQDTREGRAQNVSDVAADPVKGQGRSTAVGELVRQSRGGREVPHGGRHRYDGHTEQ